MDSTLIKRIIERTQQDINHVKQCSDNDEQTEQNRFSILASVQAIESDMRRLRKMLKA